jgi:hypothetical protein
MTTCPTTPSAHFLAHNPVVLPVMPDLDQQIAQAHHDLEAVELEAKQLEARIRRIAGMERLLPDRNYGRPVNVQALKENLTARSLINNADPALASFLGIQSGSSKAAEERAEARRMAAEAMRLRTERLQQENAAAQQQRERYAIAGINPINNRRVGQ